MYKAPRKASNKSALSFVFGSALGLWYTAYEDIARSSHTTAWVLLLTNELRSNLKMNFKKDYMKVCNCYRKINHCIHTDRWPS